MIRFASLRVLACLGLAVAVPLSAPDTAYAEEQPVKPVYVSLGEFTINLPVRGGMMSYAIIGISIDAIPSAATELRSVEPRLKETVMRRLMAMADSGVLQPEHTDLAAVKLALIAGISE